MYKLNALKHYQKMELESRVASASPHALVALLLDGVLKNIFIAKGAIERRDIPAKGEATGKAIRILDSLRSSLDGEQGGDMADNLRELYSYMERRLMKANLDSDAGLMDEVATLVHQIKSGWDAIPQEFRGA